MHAGIKVRTLATIAFKHFTHLQYKVHSYVCIYVAIHAEMALLV